MIGLIVDSQIFLFATFYFDHQFYFYLSNPKIKKIVLEASPKTTASSIQLCIKSSKEFFLTYFVLKIKDQNYNVWVFIIERIHISESFLTSRIPNLHFDHRSIYFHTFKSKIYSDSCVVLVLKIVIGIFSQNGSFAYIWITH